MSKGFSLIELMVVIGIISILSQFFVIEYDDFKRRAEASEAIYNLSAVKTSQEIYIEKHGEHFNFNVGEGDDHWNVLGLDYPDHGKFVYDVVDDDLDDDYERIVAYRVKNGWSGAYSGSFYDYRVTYWKDDASGTYTGGTILTVP